MERAQQRIHTLPPLLANQIAAGEVVERPASVVKELLENSLDAGATRVSVAIERGGVGFIRVSDDGCGIHRDDLYLALTRHSTSKIASLEELQHLHSLGFRGEALPSIASVSRLTINSRLTNEHNGWRLSGEDAMTGGKPEPVSHPLGTTVEIRDLFFNTPARRKFLRAERTEARHVEDTVKRIALSRPRVEMHLRNNQRVVLSLKAAHTEEEQTRRVARICSAKFIGHAVAIGYEGGGLRLGGWLGLPSFSRSQVDSQFFFVNGRMVRDRLVNHAIRQAYTDALDTGRHPGYVLYLELDPADVDVNVHPTKYEVRFREGRLVHDFLSQSLSRALEEGRKECVTVHGQDLVFDRVSIGPDQCRFEKSDYRETNGVNERALDYSMLSRRDEIQSQSVAPGAKVHDGAFAPLIGRALTQVHGKYLVAESVRGLFLLDIHAARERVLHDQLRAAIDGDRVLVQPLLLPLTLKVSPGDMDCAEKNQGLLKQVGVDLRRAGPDTLLLRELPEPLKHADPERLIRALLTDLLNREVSRQARSLRTRLVATMVRHGCEPRDRNLSQDEMDILLRQLADLDTALEGPKTHSIWVELDTDEISDLFAVMRSGRSR